MVIKYSAYTEKGIKRDKNDDCILIDNCVITNGTKMGELSSTALAVVCDGVGGECHGDVAAKLSAECFLNYPLEGASLLYLTRTITEANERIMQLQREREDCLRMATTLAGIIIKENDYMVFNLGDTRIYKGIAGHAIQISEDHTKASEITNSSGDKTIRYPGFYHNILTRYVGGTGKACIPYIGVHSLEPGESFLLCSDGVYKTITEEALLKMLSFPCSLEEKQQMIVQMLKESKHKDDTSLVLLECL